MSKISILDVTLRDGGIVNDFRFGEKNIKSIVKALEEAGLPFVELGYLEKFTGTMRNRSQFCNERVIEEYLLDHKKPGTIYVAMMDYGKFDAEALCQRTEKGIDGIRLAFHKRNYREALPLYQKIIDKGYQVYMQPMVTLHYTEDELKALVDAANEMEIRGLYFVDTFGQMLQSDIERLATLFHERLRPDIALGFHSHNNLQMAYANSIAFLRMPMNRDKMLDSSIMGMGRGAGNLNTELILSHLNQHYGENYQLSPLLNIMDRIIEPIKAQYPWGYSTAYYLSAVNDCSPIYANHYYKKHMLPMEQLNELLGMLEGERRISFNKEYAEQIYRAYNGKEPYDDHLAIAELTEVFKDKSVCVLAPGKSLSLESEKVKKAAQEADIVVSLNCDVFGADYILVSRQEAFIEAEKCGKKIIAPSNITRKAEGDTLVIDYYRWITVGSETHDSAGFIVIQLLTELGAREIHLAGFDGFCADIRRNYFDEALERPISPEQIAEMNGAFREYIRNKAKDYKIYFETQTIYSDANQGEIDR